MSTVKRYYWLKLHDDFFDSKRIKKLRKMAGGDTYTIIYLKMQLLAMKNDGIIKWDGLEQTVADELALDLDESPDDIRVTLAYLLSCGLAETSDDVSFFFPFAVSNTGSETAAAQRMRSCRTRQREINGAALPEETEQFREQMEPAAKSKVSVVRHKYGSYKNVLLSDEDLEKLKSEFPDDWESRIERLSEYIASTGKSYKNHLATIRNWARRDKQNQNMSRGTGSQQQDGTRWDNLWKDN